MTDRLTLFEFDELVARWSPRLKRYLARFLHDNHLAEDALQEVWLKASKSYDPSRPPLPWLIRVATNSAVDLLRRRNYQNGKTTDLVDDLPGREADPQDAAVAKQNIEWVREAIATLPPSLERTVGLIAIEGKTFPEASEALGTPVSTLKDRMYTEIPRKLRRHDRATLVQLSGGKRTYSYGSK